MTETIMRLILTLAATLALSGCGGIPLIPFV